MKRKLHLPIHAMSINSFYYANKSHGPTQTARDWISQVCWLLNSTENKQALIDLRNEFDPEKHVYHIHLKVGTPKMFTKDGDISRQSIDISNTEKVFLDILFDKKYAESRQCENLCTDDKYLTRLISEKHWASQPSIAVTIHVKSRPKCPAK